MSRSKFAEQWRASIPVEGETAVTGSPRTLLLLVPVAFYCCSVWPSLRTRTSQRLKQKIRACKAARLWCEAARDVRGAVGRESEKPGSGWSSRADAQQGSASLESAAVLALTTCVCVCVRVFTCTSWEARWAGADAPSSHSPSESQSPPCSSATHSLHIFLSSRHITVSDTIFQMEETFSYNWMWKKINQKSSLLLQQMTFGNLFISLVMYLGFYLGLFMHELIIGVLLTDSHLNVAGRFTALN